MANISHGLHNPQISTQLENQEGFWTDVLNSALRKYKQNTKWGNIARKNGEFGDLENQCQAALKVF